MLPTMEQASARDIMQPLPPAVSLRTTTTEALVIMKQEDTAFLPVVTPEEGRFVGVVLRRALEFGCAAMGHRETECLVVNHLKADADFCFQEEPARVVLRSDEPATPAGGIRGSRVRTRPSLPIVVVDEHKVPVGMIDRALPRP